MARRSALLVLLAAAAARALAANAPTSTAPCPFAGFTGKLSMLEHNVAGTVAVGGCSSVTIDRFTYDGQAPAAYFWCSESSSPADMKAGFRAAPTRLDRPFAGEKVVLSLVPEADFATNCRVFGVWCETFSANFGDVAIERPPTAAAKPATGRASTAAPAKAAASPAKPATTRQCANGGYTGFAGDILTLEHQVGGRVRVDSDCGVSVNGFTYDGQAPDAYWRCSRSSQRADLLRGFRASPSRLARPYSSEDVAVALVPGADLAGNCSFLSVWCERFEAAFGGVKLGPPAAASAAAVSAGAPAPASCRELLPQRLQITWPKVAAGAATVEATLVATGLPPRSWFAFGFADPAKGRSAMVGSDVVVVGILPSGQTFAVDYFLGSKEQCDYAGSATEGVCPDPAGAAGGGKGGLRLLKAVKTGDVMAVTFSRPAAATDAFDRAWPTGAATAFAVFAWGPLGEASTAAKPIVLYHGPTNRSPDKFPFTFGAPSACTRPLMPSAGAGGGGLLPAPAGPRQPIKTLAGVTVFNVTTGTNRNYPNPPAWGLSFWVNGAESPQLRVTRGAEYTFRVMAGASHPLYLTSSPVGGAANGSEAVFAGGAEAHGTAAKPYMLKWTPGSGTPDVLYYQCFDHQKLGWRVIVSDGAPAGGNSKGSGAASAAATSAARRGRRLLGRASAAAAAFGVFAGLVR